jgi:hypothetical protein
MQNFESKNWTGRDPEKPRLSLDELIDRYVPMKTRGEVNAMRAAYEERVYDLLWQLHQMREQMEKMAEWVDTVEREYTDKVMPKLPFGRITADSHLEYATFTDYYRLTWQPDPYRAQIAMSHAMISHEETPALAEAALRQLMKRFEDGLKDHIRFAIGNLMSVPGSKLQVPR